MKAKTIKTPSQLSITWGLTKFATKASLRNRAGYFFGLIFPIVFISVFGFFSNGSSAMNIGVADNLSHDNAVYQVIDKLSKEDNAPVKITTGSQADLEKQLSQGKIDSVLEPDDISATKVKLATSNASPQGAASSQSFISGIVSQLNLQAAQQASHLTTLPFAYSSKEISGKSYRYIDFLLPGQIGFSMLSFATFGIGFSLITLRKTLVLKRMFATTVKPISFVLSQCLSRGFQAVIQTAILVGFGVAVFHFNLAHGWVTFLEMVLLSFLGVLSFLGFGIFIANVAKDEQSLPIALNIFNLPQMLLAGVFFSVEAFPKWVQNIGNNLPLAYLNIAMRKISTEGVGFSAILPYIAGMLAWALVAYILAALTFKSE